MANGSTPDINKNCQNKLKFELDAHIIQNLECSVAPYLNANIILRMDFLTKNEARRY